MSKETFYFGHDYNARSDPKVQSMIMQFNSSGYGLYWCLIEMLYEEETHKLPMKDYVFNAIAMQMQCKKEQVKDFINFCISDVELLKVEGESFYSLRVLKTIDNRNDIKEKRSMAARKRWNDASAMQTNANAMQSDAKKRKEKKKKEKIILPFDSISFKETWDDWRVHRKELKKPLTELSIKRQLNKLGKHSEADAIAVIEQSILNGWVGFFELKEEKKTKPKAEYGSTEYYKNSGCYTDAREVKG